MVEVMGFERPDYLAGKQVTHARMEEIGPVLLMDGKEFEARLDRRRPQGDRTDPRRPGKAVARGLGKLKRYRVAPPSIMEAALIRSALRLSIPPEHD